MRIFAAACEERLKSYLQEYGKHSTRRSLYIRQIAESSAYLPTSFRITSIRKIHVVSKIYGETNHFGEHRGSYGEIYFDGFWGLRSHDLWPLDAYDPHVTFEPERFINIYNSHAQLWNINIIIYKSRKNSIRRSLRVYIFANVFRMRYMAAERYLSQ